MRRVTTPALQFTRLIRRKSVLSQGILDEGATFSDVHSVVLDPVTRLPYPDQDYVEKTSKHILKERNKTRYGNKKRSSGEIVFDHIPIEEQIVMLFPGQGAQYIGMGKMLIDCTQSKRIFNQSSEILGYDLLKLCIEGPKSKLDQTLYCQPAIFVSSIAALEKFKVENPDSVDKITHVAGFSVGELAALVASGILKFEDALRIVHVRCQSMHECNQLIRSGMLTVRINAASRIDDAMRDARQVSREKGEMEICEIANYLFCGMRVIGANETCMRFLEDNQKYYGFQVIKRLAVSGAFHTRQMESAMIKVREVVASVDVQKATCNVYSNYTGHSYGAKKSEIRSAIYKQVTNPVKWEQIQQILYRKHQDYKFPRFVEVGPGRQLGAMLLQTSKKAHAHYEHYSC